MFDFCIKAFTKGKGSQHQSLQISRSDSESQNPSNIPGLWDSEVSLVCFPVSQMLLGMYRCTDVPGKFVWQPGTLTQAVAKGQWILLEDIDHAPLDVVRFRDPGHSFF